MKLTGKFLIKLWDGVEQYHRNGNWWVGTSQSIDWDTYEEGQRNEGRFQRLAMVGQTLEARSFTGATGVTGQVLAQSPNGRVLVVGGEAWGASHVALCNGNRVGWSTHTFSVRTITPGSACYTGPLVALKGHPANHQLVKKMPAAWAAAVAERAAAAARIARAIKLAGRPAPEGVLDAKILTQRGRRVTWEWVT
jgi:hypothetical protein